ncbi:MAG TPA: hypothetical protein VHQ39_13930, partial [Dongiaceae bacterium]|nr:hypothetical protein [Dongiaceae bacterium]
EHGLSANTQRQAMNPMDLSDAFAKMIAADHKPAAIAAAFSMKAREVEQHLALAKLSPPIKEKVRAGKVPWETAHALTIAGDHKTQDAMLKRFGQHGGWQIRQALKEDAPQIRHALFDAKEYEKAGGTYQVDLFFNPREDDDEAGTAKICADSKLFWSLQQPAIDAKIAALEAEGWKAVDRTDGYINSFNWPKRGAVKKADRGKYTLLYNIHASGQLDVSDRARPDGKAAKVKTGKKGGKSTQADLATSNIAPEADAGQGLRAFTQALTMDLRYRRGLQVKEAIDGSIGGLGLRILLFMLITHDSDRGQGGAGSLHCSASRIEADDVKLMESFSSSEREWRYLFKMQRAELWTRITNLADHDIDAMLVHAAARIFSGQATSWQLGQLILATNQIPGRLVFTPDEEFWKRTPKPYMVAQLAPIAGDKAAKMWGKQKTGDLARLMGGWFTKPEAIDADKFGFPITPDMVTAFKAWVPAALKVPSPADALATVTADDADYPAEFDDEEGDDDDAGDEPERAAAE